MKIIPLQKAFKLLKNCSAIIFDDSILLWPTLADLIDDNDNQFMYFGWTNEDGLEFNIRFLEGNNREVKIVGNSMLLIDDEGNETQIILLNPIEIEMILLNPTNIKVMAD